MTSSTRFLRLPVLVLATVTLCLSACDSVDTSERYYNEDAAPPVGGSVDFANLSPGQHIAGTHDLTLDLDSLGGRVEQVLVFLDDREIATFTEAPFSFRLDTRQWPEGRHELFVAVYVQGDDLGLLGLSGAPSLSLVTDLVFDQSYPSQVAVTSASLTDDAAQIAWEQSEDANFYAYLVARYSNWSNDYNPAFGEPIIEVIYDRSVTTFADAALPQVYGAETSYSVFVWNRDRFVPGPPSEPLIYGTPSPNLESYGQQVPSADGELLFAVTGRGELAAFDPATGEAVRTLTGRDFTDIGTYIFGFATNPARSELYIPITGTGDNWTGTRVFAVDAETFDVLRWVPLAVESRYVVATATGRFVCVANGSIYLLDGDTGEIVDSVDAGLERYTHAVSISPDHRTAYLYEYGANFKPDVAHAVHIDEGIGDIRSRLLGAFSRSGGHLSAIQVDPDGRVYTPSGPGEIEVLDGTSLDVLDRLDLGLTYPSELTAFRLAGPRLYVAHTTELFGFQNGTRLVEHRTDTLSPTRSWDLIDDDVYSITTSGEHALYVSRWAIEL